MSKPRIMTSDEVQQAYKDYKQGMSIDDLALKHYVSRTTIWTEFKRAELPIDMPRRSTRIDMVEATKMYLQNCNGKTMRKIAAEHNIHWEAVRYRIRKYREVIRNADE